MLDIRGHQRSTVGCSFCYPPKLQEQVEMRAPAPAQRILDPWMENAGNAHTLFNFNLPYWLNCWAAGHY